MGVVTIFKDLENGYALVFDNSAAKRSGWLQEESKDLMVYESKEGKTRKCR